MLLPWPFSVFTAEVERPSREELAALPQCVRQPLLHGRQVGQLEAVQQAGELGGQRIHGLLEIAVKVDVARLDAPVYAGALLHQQAVTRVSGRITRTRMTGRAASVRRCRRERSNRP